MKKLLAITILSITALSLIYGIGMIAIRAPEALWFIAPLGFVPAIAWAITEIKFKP